MYAALVFIGIVVVFFLLEQKASAGDSSNSCGDCGACMVVPVTDIASFAQNAGFSGDDLTTAIAIALAESGGKVAIVGDLTLGRSIGLWQINLRAHPEYDEQSLTDPQTNANAAYQIYSDAGQSFHPWSTFKSGAYLSFINTANAAVNA